MLSVLSMRLFGKYLVPYLDSFDNVKESLHKSGMQYTIHEYLSLIVFTTAIAFVCLFFGSLIFVTLFIRTAAGYFAAVFISLVATIIAFALGYYYPTMQANNLKGKIDKSLPFAIFYMATTASSGAHPINIFRMLSVRGGVVGEEANRIYTNVKTLGMDMVTALEKAASRSPSPTFAELLWGMVSILTTGGNLEAYLRGKTKTAMAQYRRALNDYAKTIALYTEIYITLIIVGSLFFIILLAILSPLVGGNTLFLQTFIIFFMIPLVSIGFIMLLKGASPIE